MNYEQKNSKQNPMKTRKKKNNFGQFQQINRENVSTL